MRRRLVALRAAARRAAYDGCDCGGTLEALVSTVLAEALAAGRDDEAGVTAVDRLASGQHAHRLGEAFDRTTADDLVVVLERLGDQVDGPGHRQGNEDQRAQVHTSEVRFPAAL